MPPAPRADLEALAAEALRRCDVLGACSEEPQRLTRTFLSAAMHQATDHVERWMREAGLEAHCDAVGNVIGHRRPQSDGAQPSGAPSGAPSGGRGEPTFVLGSHLDTVPDAGKYDGILGVLLAIAAAQALREEPLPFALDVIGFADEEGVRFGVPFLGSRAVAGRYDAALLALRDGAGVPLERAIRAAGGAPPTPGEALYRPGELLGYLEAHIEQGPVLESLGLPLGVVETITSTCRLDVEITGTAGHAGTVPMDRRRDALAGEAALVLDAERVGRDTPGLVATVGELHVEPGASNVIPGRVRLSIDIRHGRDAVRAGAVHTLTERLAALCRERGLVATVAVRTEQPAVSCDPQLVETLAAAVADSGVPVYRLVSGAGHDAAIMAHLAPVAMLFVRSPGGVSHLPAEAVVPEDLPIALEAMLCFVRRVASRKVGRDADGALDGPV